MRNIGLVSMIFCVAPVVCAAPEASLTKQEQEDVKKWVAQVKKVCPEFAQLLKFAIADTKEWVSSVLHKVMYVGRSRAEYAKELIKSYEMNPIAAFLTLDWLKREPAIAEKMLKRGFDSFTKKKTSIDKLENHL